ncbi:hypothetical protein SESBI_34420 [Sesbania bispinosa]|nr:hypothetical protein SESBI_34420 [Sesbania bispinosa]
MDLTAVEVDGCIHRPLSHVVAFSPVVDASHNDPINFNFAGFFPLSRFFILVRSPAGEQRMQQLTASLQFEQW